MKSNFIKNADGFTLIELIVVLAMFAILSTVVVPRILNYLSTTKDNFLLISSMISKTFDDAFLNNRTNFLVVHCSGSSMDFTEFESSIFQRRNALSAVMYNDNLQFVDIPNRLLKYRVFPSSFAITEVELPDGSRYNEGNIFIPFYPSGYSTGAIIHILVNQEKEWSVVVQPYIKEPKIIEGFITYENLQ